MAKISANDIAWDVTLTQLEIMALLMLVKQAEDSEGLSEPARSAQKKLTHANTILLGFLMAND